MGCPELIGGIQFCVDGNVLDLSGRSLGSIIHSEAFQSILREESIQTVDISDNEALSMEALRQLGAILAVDNLVVDERFMGNPELLRAAPSVQRLNGRPRWAFSVPPRPTGRDKCLDHAEAEVLTKLEKYTASYQLAKVENPNERVKVYYILDEVGSRVCHRPDPK